MDMNIHGLTPNHSPQCVGCKDWGVEDGCTGCWVFETLSYTEPATAQVIELVPATVEAPLAQAA